MEEKKDSKSKVIIIVLLIVIVLLLIGVGLGVFFVLNNNSNENSITETETPSVTTNDNPLVLSYDKSAIALDQNSLEKQYQEMLEKVDEGNVALEYKNIAFSDDGVNFECYLANSERNTQDMFIAIYTDASCTEQIYLSGLLAPGSGIESFVSDIPFEKNTEQNVVALFSMVKDDHKTMTSQTAVALTLSIN